MFYKMMRIFGAMLLCVIPSRNPVEWLCLSLGACCLIEGTIAGICDMVAGNEQA